MSVSTEVQRTLVKSPPELWSELSNPEALARHLADLGEIRITSVEPETKVEWEAEGASGVVHLKQSGWGTKVTLSVTREAPTDNEPESVAAVEPLEPQPAAVVEPEPVVEPKPTSALEPELVAIVETDTEPVAIEPDPETEPDRVAIAEPGVENEPEAAVAAEPEPRPGFFARLFRKRRAKSIAMVEQAPERTATLEAKVEPDPEPEVVALAVPEPVYPERPTEPAVDLAAELEAVEAQMTEETTELLTGVLDRLGAAHHRPFSRG